MIHVVVAGCRQCVRVYMQVGMALYSYVRSHVLRSMCDANGWASLHCTSAVRPLQVGHSLDAFNDFLSQRDWKTLRSPKASDATASCCVYSEFVFDFASRSRDPLAIRHDWGRCFCDVGC